MWGAAALLLGLALAKVGAASASDAESPMNPKVLQPILSALQETQAAAKPPSASQRKDAEELRKAILGRGEHFDLSNVKAAFAQVRSGVARAAAPVVEDSAAPPPPPPPPPPASRRSFLQTDLEEAAMATTLTATATQHAIAGDSPEDISNIAGYEVTQPTPPPAAYNGVYCRGGACQFRVPPPVPPPPPTPFPNIFYGLNKREFCRGLSCIGAPFGLHGWGGSGALDAFNMNCAHLYDHIGGGMVGPAGTRSMMDVRQSFLNWCVQRVGILEVGACPAYAEVVIMGQSPFVDAPSQGGTAGVCTNTFLFIGAVKAAEIDLKLIESALPSSASLLSKAINQFGTGGVGPDSHRGRAWARWLHDRGWNVPERLLRDNLPPSLNKPTTKEAVSFVECPPELPQHGPAAPHPYRNTGLLSVHRRMGKVAGFGFPDNDAAVGKHPMGLPKYDQNPACASGVNAPGPKGTMYQILAGSPDGLVPPAEIKGNLLEFCKNQMSEIMMGFGQTGDMTVTMTKDWCNWQASVSSWTGPTESGHPDWNFRTCNNMANFVAYALKGNLGSPAGLSAVDVCEKMFLSLGPVHRVDALVKDAWTVSLRGGPELGLSTSGNDEEMKKLMQAAQEYAASLMGKLRGQRDAFNDLNGAKMDTAGFDDEPVEASPPAKPAPELPALLSQQALLSRSRALPTVEDAANMEQDLGLDATPVASSQPLRHWGS